MKKDTRKVIFGLWEYPFMLRKINRLLKPYGLKLFATHNPQAWGDQIQIELVEKEEE